MSFEKCVVIACVVPDRHKEWREETFWLSVRAPNNGRYFVLLLHTGVSLELCCGEVVNLYCITKDIYRIVCRLYVFL